MAKLLTEPSHFFRVSSHTDCIMISQLEDVLGKTCLIGLSYFDSQGELLKQNRLAGTVTAVDKETGITLELLALDGKAPSFILPANLHCWFAAPAGEFHTSHTDVKITNPDFLVTWDIHQTKEDQAEGEQQWWEWVANTENPTVG